ncbi:bzip transcription factor [Stemphylium lycopersici]|nr:bzip transcription factor [Stemphylium lycopersici]
MAEIQQQPQFDWAGEAFTTLHHLDLSQQQDKRAAAFSNPATISTQAFSIPPSLLTLASLERYGQITPPEEHSPTHPLRSDQREGSLPAEQLRSETTFWPKQEPSPLQMTPPEEPSPKRRRTSRQSFANQDDVASTMPGASAPPQPDNGDTNPQPPKRKRGRPKSQPQMVEAYTADGYPFQVSSARQTHLEKNRVAAHKCRQRKKEYINTLEGRAREFSTKNKMLKENVAMLREEVLSLKNEVLRHAGCGFWAVDEYLARCAGGLLGMEAPAPGMRHSISRQNSSNQSPAIPTSHLISQQAREPSMTSITSADADDMGGLELLKDFTDEDMDDMGA